MDLSVSSSTSSGSFDGAVFARYLLEPDLEGCTPPRITRFSFEDEYARDHLTASLSGQFSSYYGLPYDNSPPPEAEGNSQDTASEHSSRGPITPPAPGHLPLPLDFSSQLSTSVKPLEDPFTQDSTSFLLHSHSLLPGQSLLSDTPSYLGLVSARSEELSSRPTHTRPQTMPAPMPLPTRHSISPAEDCPRLSTSNRGATMRQLALELPMSRARSGSLSTLIHALEDASPGWYESLMDSALPQRGSPSPLSAANVPPREAALRPARRLNEGTHSSTPVRGLPKDMLTSLAELEALAVVVGRLPIPRPRTMALEVAATAFFSPSAAPPLPRRDVSPRSPPLTPLEEERERQPTVRYAATAQARERDQPVDSPSSSPTSEQYNSPCASADEHQPAFTSLAQHPKLTKTSRMRSSLPANRFLAPAPRTPSWRAGRHSAIPRMSTQTTTRADPPPPLPQEDMKTPRKAPQTPHKTPKPLNLHSLFRRRPSAPPMPMQPPDLGGSPVRNTAKRAAHLSEPVMRPLHPPSGDSPLGKSTKQYGAASEATYSLQPLSPLGSFLPM